MTLIDFQRKYKKGLILLGKFYKNPALTYDEFFQFEFEKKSGIVTRGFISETDLGISMNLEPYHYVAGGNIYLTRVFKKMKIKQTDSIIDLGCGMGSSMLYMAKFPFRKISGVEYSKELYEGCQKNLDKLNDARLNVFYRDAGEFDSFDDYNYFFMFNPFGKSTLIKVLDRIVISYKENKRNLKLIYKNPVFDDEILYTGIFKKISEFKTESSYNFIVYGTVF